MVEPENPQALALGAYSLRHRRHHHRPLRESDPFLSSRNSQSHLGETSELLGSLAMAVLCYFIITNEYIGHFVFIFPELLFVILACTLLLGRYTGYRVLEMQRFKALVAKEKA